MEKYTYVGLDEHAENIAVAEARQYEKDAHFVGRVANRDGDIRKMVAKLAKKHGGDRILSE